MQSRPPVAAGGTPSRFSGRAATPDAGGLPGPRPPAATTAAQAREPGGTTAARGQAEGAVAAFPPPARWPSRPGPGTLDAMETGDRVGPFEVLMPLSAGGMGEVYLGEDMRTCEKVALKVLPRKFRANDYLISRFLAEAEMYRRLGHPNIVRFVGSGVHEGIHYVAMEYIRGQNLSELLDQLGRIPVDMALSMMLDVAYALSYAHQRGIVHRDVKPQNVMLTEKNVIKLIDFGVAQAEQDNLRTGNLVVGSLCYNSPEQNQGKPVDERSDVYGLGLLYYELLTGQRVLPNRSISEIILAQAELDSRLVPPSRREVDCPPDLDALIVKMLRFDPETRVGSMDEVIGVLQPLVQGNLRQLPKEARDAKVTADRDLADTHYWKAMNHLAEGRYLEALGEFERILDLRLFDHQGFRRQVAEQLHFVSWRLSAHQAEAVSTPAEIGALLGEGADPVSDLQMDVLQKLHQIYSLQPHDGIRSAMSNLLSFYRERLREDPGDKKSKARPGDVPIERYVPILRKLARLYGKIGDQGQQRIVLHKLVATLHKVRDPDLCTRLWKELDVASEEEPILIQGYAEALGRQGDPEGARRERIRLARAWSRREEHARAVVEWTALHEKRPDPETEAGLAEAREQLEEGAHQTERLIELLARLETSSDRASAINFCLRFLEDHPDDTRVLEKLLDLQMADGRRSECADTFLRMGRVHFDRGERDRARDFFAEALHIDPGLEPAQHYLVDILRDEDPTLCDRSSPKEILRELYVRLGMGAEAVKDLRARLRGGDRDLELLDRIEEIHRRCKETPEAAAAARDRVGVSIRAGDFERAKAAAVRFLERYAGFRELLRELADDPRSAEDHELMALLVR